MKYDTPKKEQEETFIPSTQGKGVSTMVDPKGVERFTVKRELVGEYVLNSVYHLFGTSYRLAAIMKDGDGVSLEFVKAQ